MPPAGGGGWDDDQPRGGGQAADGAERQRPAVHGHQGYQVPGTTNGDGAIRCVYLTNGASLSGFTLTNGARGLRGIRARVSGGGVWCESIDALVSNCVLTGNSACATAAGRIGGTLNNCTLTRQLGCTHGGGASGSTLNNCTLTGNSAGYPAAGLV